MRIGRLFCLGASFFLLGTVFSLNLHAQAVTSVSDGPWNNTGTWSSGTIPDNTNSTSIAVNHNVTIPNGYTVNNIPPTTINGSLTVAGAVAVDPSANSLVVNGLLAAQNTSAISGSNGLNVVFNSGSTYRHDFTTLQGSVPLATWDPNSTVLIAGYTSGKNMTAAGNWSQNFGHFTYQCPAQVGLVNFSGLLTSIAGDLTISSSGNTQVFLGSTQTYTLPIGGSVAVSGTARLVFSTTGAPIFNITNDLNITSTSAGGSATSTSGNPVLNIGRDFLMNAPGGVLRTGAGGNGGATFNIGRDFNITAGTLSESGADPGSADINFTNSSSHNFTNTGSIQNWVNYTVSANDILTAVGESKLAGGVNSSLNLAGTLVLNSLHASGAIQTGFGASTFGNVFVQNRTYQSGAILIYGGAAAQIMGNGNPSNADVITQINNAAGVTLSNGTPTFETLGILQVINGTFAVIADDLTVQDLILLGGSLTFSPIPTHAVTVNGNFQLTSGTVVMNSSAATADLVINGDILPGAGSVTFAGVNNRLIIGGTGAITSDFPLPGASTIRAITVNRSGGGTLRFVQDVTSTDVTINAGSLDMNNSKNLSIANNLNIATGGTLFFEGSTLTIQRFFNNTLTGGVLSSDGTSTLIINGSGALGTLAFSGAGNTLNTLVLDRPTAGTLVTLNSPLTITTSLMLTDGVIANTSGLTLSSGAIITRTANAGFSAASATPGGGPYDIIYNNGVAPVVTSLNTTPETKGSVRDVTVNVTGTIVAATTLSVQRTLFLNSGVFSNSTAKLNMVSGSTIARNSAATFTGSTPTGGPYNLIYSGTTLSTTNEAKGSLNNVTTDATGTLTTTFLFTVPGTMAVNSGTLNILANTLTMGNGATFVRQSGTTIMGVSPLGGPYNLVYNGSALTTQLEMLGTLNNVTTNLSGTVAQANPLTAAGTLLVNTGTWNAGANNVTINALVNAATLTAPSTLLTLTGNFTDNGVFNHNNGTVVFNGNTFLLGSSVTPFNNLQLNTGKAVTFPATVDVAGNIVFQSGSTFNHNSGNVIMNGSGVQSIDSQGAQFYGITVSKAGGSVDLVSALPLANVLSINSATAVGSNGFLTVLSQPNGPGDDTGNDGSIGPIAAGGSVAGNVIVQRFITDKGLGNRYISTAVSGVDMPDLTDDFSVFPGYIRFYNEAIRGTIDKGYTNISSLTLPLQVGRGYLAWMADGVNVQWDVTGNINAGSVALPVTFTNSPNPNANADGWNLVGNPFPSPVIWDNTPGSWVRSAVDPVITVYDISGTASYTYNYTNGSGSLPNGMIATGQSFWVHLNASGSLTVNETAKISGAGGRFFRTRTVRPDQLVLSLSNKTFKDNSVIVLDPKATRGFDPLYDGIKFQDEQLSIYFRDGDGRHLGMSAYNELSTEVNIPVEIMTNKPGDFVIDFSGDAGFLGSRQLYLIDRYAGKSLTVLMGSKYPFAVDKAGTVGDRFYLSSSPEVDERPATEGFTLFPNPVIDDLAIQTGVEEPVRVDVYNALGEVVQSATVLESGVMSTKGWSKGLYIIKGRYQKGIASKRVIKQ